jgi:hypothetical protein
MHSPPGLPSPKFVPQINGRHERISAGLLRRKESKDLLLSFVCTATKPVTQSGGRRGDEPKDLLQPLSFFLSFRRYLLLRLRFRSEVSAKPQSPSAINAIYQLFC